MKSNKYIILGILLTAFLIGLIATNNFSSNLNSIVENKDDNILKEVDKKPLNSDPFKPTPLPPNELLKWNFPNNTIKAFHWIMNSEGEGGFFGTNYYNITSMPHLYNQTGQNFWEYCVQIEEVYYNTTYNKHLPNPLNPYLLNVSLLNVSIPDYPFFPQSSDLSQIGPGYNGIFLLNAFIPTNSSILALNWSSSHLKLFYDILLSPGSSVTVNETSKNIYFLSLDTIHYVNLTYDSEGILSRGETLFMVEGIETHILVNVDDDINPVDDIEWNVKEGDELYYGMGPTEYKFNVTKIVNETYTLDGIGIVVLEVVWANLSSWIYEPGYFIGWSQPEQIRIGSANEIYPLFIVQQPIIPFLLPKNYDMKVIAEVYKFNAENRWDQVTYGDTWVKIYNSTTQEYTTFEYNISGLIELLDVKYLLDYFGQDNFGVYLKESTEIAAGFHSFNLKPLGINDFNVTLNISVTDTTHLMYSAFDINPINITLNYGALFIDVWVNDSTYLDQTNFSPINITIKYDPSRYPNMRLYYINTSLNTSENSWLPVDFKNLGNGVIVFAVNYTGIFAFTNAPIPAFLLGDDDDDDDGGETAPAVPLGNYFLIFLLVGMIGIVLYTKRKILFK